TAMLQADLFGHAPQPAVPPGFDYWPDVLSACEQAGVVEQLQRLDFRPYEHMGYQGFRQIAAFVVVQGLDLHRDAGVMFTKPSNGARGDVQTQRRNDSKPDVAAPVRPDVLYCAAQRLDAVKDMV